jgi:hypothetical protein
LRVDFAEDAVVQAGFRQFERRHGFIYNLPDVIRFMTRDHAEKFGISVRADYGLTSGEDPYAFGLPPNIWDLTVYNAARRMHPSIDGFLFSSSSMASSRSRRVIIAEPLH